MTFGEKLQSLRQRAGMSQDALAERLQVSRQAVSRWERDETMPETDKVVALADIFGVTTDYLLRLQPEQTEPEEKQPPPQERKDWVERFLAFSKRKWYLLGWVLIAWGVLDLVQLALFYLAYRGMLGGFTGLIGWDMAEMGGVNLLPGPVRRREDRGGGAGAVFRKKACTKEAGGGNAVKGIFWGFFLIFINFYVTINGHTLNLLPTFAGYILLYRAAGELLGESGRFGKLRPFAVAVAIYTGILWVGDLLGVTGANWLSTLLELAALAVALYISWSVIQAILEMETHYGTDLNGTSARTAWFVLLAAQIAGTLGGLLLDALALMALIALLVGIIWFLAALWKCAGLYDGLPPKDAGLENL